MSKKRKLPIHLERDDVTVLSHAIMLARKEAIVAMASAKGIEKDVLQGLIRKYGEILNRMETTPWLKF